MAAPKNLKSVFGEIPPPYKRQRASLHYLVGNIPYDATEEKLKDIFSEAGPVVSFRSETQSLPAIVLILLLPK